MSDIDIPDAAVEAARAAIHDKFLDRSLDCWPDFEAESRAAVEAAAPHIAARALEDAAGEMTRLWSIGKKPYAECSKDELADYNPYVHMKPEAWLRNRAADLRTT